MRASTRREFRKLLLLAYARGRSDQICVDAAKHPTTGKPWIPCQIELEKRAEDCAEFLLTGKTYE